MEVIRFSPPDIREEDIQAVADAMRSGWITTGPKTKEFENELATFNHAPRCFCTNSATAALELCLRILGVGPGDEVITSAYTYTASASVICHVGATPVLVDTIPDSVFMDLQAVEDAVTERTKVIIPVDVGGVMADYDGIFALIDRKKPLFRPRNAMQESMGRIAVLADAAHSLGASYKGRKSGSVADLSCFSFHAVKNLTTAEGGAACFGDVGSMTADEIYRQMCLLALHGQTKDALKKNQPGDWEYDIKMTGYKCNMTDMAAAMGLTQLARYEKTLARRHQIYRAYLEASEPLPVTILRQEGDDFWGSAHLAITRVAGFTHEERCELIYKMGQAGIACNVHYKPLPLLTAYHNLGFSAEDYPNAMAFYENEVTLPLHTLLTDEQVAYICDTYRNLILDR